MNNKTLLALFVCIITLASCSTAYKAGQTPDDVYYSPAKDFVAKKETTRDRYEDYTKQDDQYLRMKVRNRTRWSTIDDYDYWYDSRYNHMMMNYGYYNTYGWNNNWHFVYNRPIWGSSYFYNGWNPMVGYGGYPVVINKQVTRPPSRASRPSLQGYSNSNYNNSNLGNSIRKVFTPTPSTGTYSNSNSGSTYSTTPSRAYNPSSSSSSSSPARSSSSGSSSSGGGVSRPARGGN
ncbi:hypothetical protein [Aridibaculum aurantiacum]|uniref:hypothetical protein n=1 Tax=Aridibaculum aurantiacum TaxID=2810307 RepID=UPI001A96B1F9|nr:hypothetical protein [Aridibaculum aurantiacum]